MMSLAQLWLPIALSAVAVFFASSVLHMLLRFWHMPDYRGFANEDAVRAAIRDGDPEPGMYVVPYCRMEDMKTPEAAQKYEQGPIGFVLLRANGMPNMLRSLVQWFLLCLVVSLFCAFIASAALPIAADGHRVFHVTALAALMAYATGSFSMGIWWGQPWRAVFKDAVDGLIYALVTGAVFMWLWPHS
ncbi:hypothetical protein [Oleiagrimonas soli]|uniref:Transmembrane protein n=1 Tax=Oleiagrimonas soli TaxID=1543381 RepID=A0A099CVY0_9GAMM|nr:hypothetical protein [Oleiagrimonas soli]KGI78088.1 hypothetical protein LF63_0106905 [Oleiagrimonas soli]MBB6183491.1 hypothetical protein [Oleiagrimonas soli]